MSTSAKAARLDDYVLAARAFSAPARREDGQRVARVTDRA